MNLKWKSTFLWSEYSEKIKAVVAYAIIFSFIGFCFYQCNKPDSPVKLNKENWIIQLKYYDSKKQIIDSLYTDAVSYKDSIISFLDNNRKVWYKSDFISYKEIPTEDIVSKDINIILKNGSNYSIMYIDSGRCCRPKEVLDSIKESNKESNDEDNDN